MALFSSNTECYPTGNRATTCFYTWNLSLAVCAITPDNTFPILLFHLPFFDFSAATDCFYGSLSVHKPSRVQSVWF